MLEGRSNGLKGRFMLCVFLDLEPAFHVTEGVTQEECESLSDTGVWMYDEWYETCFYESYFPQV